MKSRPEQMVIHIVWILSLVGLLASTGVSSQERTRPNQERTDSYMRHAANGSFEIDILPQSQDEETGVDVMSFSKVFSGDFAGTSSGTMLTSLGVPRTSAVYVAIERLEGSLDGRKGSFVLVHRGVMSRNRQESQVTIAPDSGTDELLGITGVLQIEVRKDKHIYTMEYSLPE